VHELCEAHREGRLLDPSARSAFTASDIGDDRRRLAEHIYTAAFFGWPEPADAVEDYLANAPTDDRAHGLSNLGCLQLLQRTVAKTNAVEDAPGVLEVLTTVAAERPSAALKAAAPIALNMASEFTMVTSEVRGLLGAALETGDAEARREAEKLIDDLAWRQVHGLRDLLDF
jgi:hypothetical protein